MKKGTGNRMKLGMFLSVSILLFITSIYFIGKKQQLFGSTFHINATFKDISGLLVGNNVRFSGINVGVVEDIQQITDSTVKVTMMINENSRRFIKKNAKAIIGSDGLMGNKIILLIPGVTGAKELANNDVLETTRAISMDDILLKVKVTSDNAADITGHLSAVMKNIREGKGTIGKLLMDEDFAQNIDATLVNVKQGTKGFKQNMDSLKQNMDAASHSFLLKHLLKKKKSKK